MVVFHFFNILSFDIITFDFYVGCLMYHLNTWCLYRAAQLRTVELEGQYNLLHSSLTSCYALPTTVFIEMFLRKTNIKHCLEQNASTCRCKEHSHIPKHQFCEKSNIGSDIKGPWPNFPIQLVSTFPVAHLQCKIASSHNGFI